MVIAIGGVICGANDWVAIEAYGHAKESWLRRFLELPNGIPSHDTFGDVLARLNSEAVRRCFMDWVQAVFVATQGQVIAFDGKCPRGPKTGRWDETPWIGSGRGRPPIIWYWAR